MTSMMEDDQQHSDEQAAADRAPDRRKLLTGIATGSLVMTLSNRPAFAQQFTESKLASLRAGGSLPANG
jgi:hypothetical protein